MQSFEDKNLDGGCYIIKYKNLGGGCNTLKYINLGGGCNTLKYVNLGGGCNTLKYVNLGGENLFSNGEKRFSPPNPLFPKKPNLNGIGRF